MIKGLTDPDIIGNKVYNVFVKALSVFKEDRQAFGVILVTNTVLSLCLSLSLPLCLSLSLSLSLCLCLSVSLSLSLSLKYPFTIVPINIANLDHTLRRESKSNVGNFIVNESESMEVVPPRDSRRILKAKETYEKWFDQIMKVMMPCEAERPQSLEFWNT